MAEQCVCTMKSEFEHLKDDILELKGTNKELIKDISIMRESHMETKLYLKQIQESQSTMLKENKENQVNMISGIQELRDKPIKHYDQIKIGVWIFAITYVLGTVFGLMKVFAK